MADDSNAAPVAAIQAEYTPRQSDLFEGYRARYRNSRSARTINAILGVTLLAAIPGLVFYGTLPLYLKALLIAAIAMIALAMFSDRFWFLLGFSLLRTRYRITLRFSLDGMTIGAPGYHKQVAWSEYASVDETPDAFVLFKSAKEFFVVPKRGFHPDDIEAFRNLAAMIFPPNLAAGDQQTGAAGA